MHATNVLTANGGYYSIKAHHRASFSSNIVLEVGITTERDKMPFEHFLLVQHTTVLPGLFLSVLRLTGMWQEGKLGDEECCIRSQTGFKTTNWYRIT